LTVKKRYVTLRLRYAMQARTITAIIALLAALFARLPLLDACAVCLTGAGGSVADAYDWSVLFLLSTPYLVVGTIAGFLAYAYRRAAAKKAQNRAAEVAPVHLAWNQKENGR
jgi:hypothetical protein